MNTIVTDPKAKKIFGLFAKLEVIRTISFRNYITILCMSILYLISVGIGLYTFLSLHEKPYLYGIFCPLLILLFISFYVIFFLGLFKFKSYKDEVNRILDQFESEHDCRIRIRKHKKGFEVNWNPGAVKFKGKNKGPRTRLKLRAKGN